MLPQVNQLRNLPTLMRIKIQNRLIVFVCQQLQTFQTVFFRPQIRLRQQLCGNLSENALSGQQFLYKHKVCEWKLPQKR